MTKIHPNTSSDAPPLPSTTSEEPSVLTVWNKSLLFNCCGFTVFDAKGNLLFRVDNYTSTNRAEILLMDAAGGPLLTIRRKRLSFGDHWLVYNGEETGSPLFSVKKNVSILPTRTLAHVAGGDRWAYAVEGCYGRRCCTVYDRRRTAAAEVRRKEGLGGVRFGDDVFNLVVTPAMDSTVAMAIVLVLDQMFDSR